MHHTQHAWPWIDAQYMHTDETYQLLKQIAILLYINSHCRSLSTMHNACAKQHLKTQPASSVEVVQPSLPLYRGMSTSQTCLHHRPRLLLAGHEFYSKNTTACHQQAHPPRHCCRAKGQHTSSNIADLSSTQEHHNPNCASHPEAAASSAMWL